MFHRHTNAAPSARHRGAAVALALGTVALASELGAAPPISRLPLLTRLGDALFPTSDPGYIPLAGSPELRFRETAAPPPIKAPPVVLYAPPEPKAATPATPTLATTTATAEPPVPAAMPDRKPPPLRPEDFLPYFQLNDGSARGAPPEGMQFTPARPELPSSKAEFRQQ
jgi:hypothetical protein